MNKVGQQRRRPGSSTEPTTKELLCQLKEYCGKKANPSNRSQQRQKKAVVAEINPQEEPPWVSALSEYMKDSAEKQMKFNFAMQRQLQQPAALRDATEPERRDLATATAKCVTESMYDDFKAVHMMEKADEWMEKTITDNEGEWRTYRACDHRFDISISVSSCDHHLSGGAIGCLSRPMIRIRYAMARVVANNA